MATVYKTPGVYVEEIPKFPPSIAPVETAIPAFLGYTEKAEQLKPLDLINVPTKIGSIAEYEAYFGFGAALKITSVELDDAKNFKSATVSNKYYMYDSLRLFYANGGGDCYIVSVGTYITAANKTDFIDPGKGIATLEKVDEPTILLFPDNSVLTGTDFYEIYDTALLHCGSLKDRVGLFHLKEEDPQGTEFRNTTGNKELKYGAAYTPWLKVNLSKNVTYRDFQNVISIGGSNKKLSDLTTGTNKDLVTAYDNAIKDIESIKTEVTGFGSKSLREQMEDLENAYLDNKTPGNVEDIMDFLYSIARSVDKLAGSLSATENIDDVKAKITSTLKGSFEKLISYEKEVVPRMGGTYTEQNQNPVIPVAGEWGGIFAAATPPAASTLIPPEPAAPAPPLTDAEKLDPVYAQLRSRFEEINKFWFDVIIGAPKNVELQKHQALVVALPLYQSILTGIQNASSTLPPSGPVAGIWAYTDRTRGVWKAPANLSVTGIVGPKDTFTASQLDALNVDVTSGKSINAIRTFTGEGTKVYGARTLAGNDNEWRYISVRRFFNFVEESTKKATEKFVFEPNDVNTWVKVQAMIENFLNTLWRQGALQGIKPEHAFYVAVGLGKTMTPLDILEGRMIIEIGMAVVRPAEFIILKFSHKMAES